MGVIFMKDKISDLVSKYDNLELNFDQKLGEELLSGLNAFQKQAKPHAPLYQKAVDALKVFVQSDLADPSRCFEEWRNALDHVRLFLQQFNRK